MMIIAWSNISNKEISDGRILKKVHDKQKRNTNAKDLIAELESKYWSEKFSHEKEIILILDNATIHQAVMIKTIANLLKINYSIFT